MVAYLWVHRSRDLLQGSQISAQDQHVLAVIACNDVLDDATQHPERVIFRQDLQQRASHKVRGLTVSDTGVAHAICRKDAAQRLQQQALAPLPFEQPVRPEGGFASLAKHRVVGKRAEQVLVDLRQVVQQLGVFARRGEQHQRVVRVGRLQPFAHGPAHLPPHKGSVRPLDPLRLLPAFPRVARMLPGRQRHGMPKACLRRARRRVRAERRAARDPPPMPHRPAQRTSGSQAICRRHSTPPAALPAGDGRPEAHLCAAASVLFDGLCRLQILGRVHE